MTTGRINQVVDFLFSFFSFFSFLSFLFFSFFSGLSFLIVFLFQNDLLLLFSRTNFVVVAECSAFRFIFSFVSRFSVSETSI